MACDSASAASVQRVCVDYDVVMVGYSTLLEGAYTRADRSVPDSYHRPGTTQALATLHRVADQPALDAGQAVLSWLASRPAPVIPVVGVTRADQLSSAIEAVTTTMPNDAVAALERIARGLPPM